MIKWMVLLITYLPLFALANVKGEIKNLSKKKIRNLKAVIWIKNPPSKSMRAAKTHNMDQLQKRFTPGVMAIQKGDAIIFENKDRIYHNVFSLNPKNKFDLGVYKGNTKYSQDFSKVIKKNIRPKKTFKNIGKVNLFCNIHANMNGIVYVFDHSYYSRIDKKLQFSFPELPHGKYTLVIDGKNFKKAKEINIKYTGKPIKLKVNLKKVMSFRAKAHTRKDGSPFPIPEDDDEFY